MTAPVRPVPRPASGATVGATHDGSQKLPRTQPYGTWRSPLQASDLAAGSVRPDDLLATGQRLLWIETRPAEGGRQALVAWDGDRVSELTPPDFNVRTRVHEYGGAPFTVIDGDVLASRYEDQRLHRFAPSGPVPATDAPPEEASVRWADARPTPDERWVIAVRELHELDAAEPRNEIVSLRLEDRHEQVLVRGRDFVAAPRPSPDGRRLAWLAWDHPHMPWDSAELWVDDLVDGALAGRPRRMAGGGDSSVCSVVWLPDGRLAFSLDTSGYWEVHVADPDGDVQRVSTFDADCGGPAWRFGGQSFAPLPDGRLACVLTERATQRLVLLDLTTGDANEVSLPWSSLERIQPFGDGVAFLAAETSGTRAVVTWVPGGSAVEIRRYGLPGLEPADCPVPEPIEVGTPDGDTTHAFLYRPAHREVTGPDDELPPLVVFTHGGPTGNVFPVLSPAIAYWTTRGFAVADVNYRGSTGFGRAYRDALLGRWGELDVMDTIAVARALADNAVVDGSRMAIRGGSAGGYTTLAVLTSPHHPFACGTSFFGVADLELLAEHTHKFESRYLDRVVGPLPESRELYRERSPVTRADQLSRPLLVLQGLEDEVVPPAQSEQIVAAAAARGVPHAYLTFEGEQHGFRRADSIVRWHETELAFYGRVMGFEPDGDLPEVPLTGDLPVA